MKETMSYLSRLDLSTILNWLLPARCVSCRRSDYFLCPNCRNLIPPAEPIEMADTEAVFNYQDPRISRAIWQLKYRGGQAIARDLADSLHEHWLENLAEWQIWHPGEVAKWLIVPIPVTKKRLRERGFNQAHLLAKYLAKLEPANLALGENILLKIRDTVSQMKTRDRKTRLRNLDGAFAVPDHREAKVKNKNILLIDDVITTGATVAEARKTLLASGAKNVSALAVAHG